MRYLRSARIRDFRSIARADVSSFGDITPLVGLNGSGKSNFMRAMNLFFNGAVEGAEPVSLRRDFREPNRKVKKQISIEVDLDYSVFPSLRTDFTAALTDLRGSPGDLITIKKEWTLDPVTYQEVVTSWAGPGSEKLSPLTTDSIPLANRLLSVVRFRYLPNHVHPSQILQAEEHGIRELLQYRLGTQQVLTDADAKKIAAVATELMKPIATAMQQATGEVGEVELTTPQNWRELAWAFGLTLKASQTEPFDALLHGSGVQSLLAFHVLHLLDTSFGWKFGWLKGAIWAVEEPESFLHAQLQSELARSLVSYASQEPLQLLLSTHSAAFLGTSDSGGLVVTVDSAGRSEFSAASKPDLLRTAYSSGATAYGHPLHTGPPKPVLLVEGRNDRDLIKRAYAASQQLNPYEILCLEDFDDQFTGGEDELASWLRYHRPAVLARPDASPVVALIDWEASDKKRQRIEDALKDHPTSKAVQWPLGRTNADLSDKWVGIEKFFSTSYVEHLATDLGLELLMPADPAKTSWKYSVDRQKLKAAKPQIHKDLAARNQADDLQPLIHALDWLSSQVSEAPMLL